MEPLDDGYLRARCGHGSTPLGERVVAIEQVVRLSNRRIVDGVGLNDSEGRQNEPAAFLRKIGAGRAPNARSVRVWVEIPF